MVHTKNKTIINNKNIIQICGVQSRRAKKKQQQKSSGSYNQPAQHLYTRDTPMYASFPNSTSLSDQAERIRFIQAMRDPQSTKSPYSIFDNGSNTFEREGNTSGVEEQAQPQIRQDDYFSRPRSLLRPVQRVELSSPFTAMSPLDRFHSPFQSAVNIDDVPADEEDEQDKDLGYQEEPISIPATRFTSPNKTHVPFQSPFRPPQEAQLDEIVIGDDEAEQLADAKDREDAQALEDELTAIREMEETKRIEKLKAGQRESRERLAKELERKKKIQAKFKAVTEKLTEFIDTGAGKVQKKSDLKKEIKALLNDPDFNEFQGNKNIGALADARKILAYLNAGSESIIAEIKLIEQDRIELDKHVRRQSPAGRANIHTLAGVGDGAGGGGKVVGGLAK